MGLSRIEKYLQMKQLKDAARDILVKPQYRYSYLLETYGDKYNQQVFDTFWNARTKMIAEFCEIADLSVKECSKDCRDFNDGVGYSKDSARVVDDSRHINYHWHIIDLGNGNITDLLEFAARCDILCAADLITGKETAENESEG
mgnify:CR=1 FL=1